MTVRRFADRFARFNLRPGGDPPLLWSRRGDAVRGDQNAGAASVGRAVRAGETGGRSCRTVRQRHSIDQLRHTGFTVGADRRTRTATECPAGTIGEIWVHGENVSAGYWNKPEETEQTFGGSIVDAPADLPTESWLRTGDLGFISDGELFIIGRMKDLLIIRGRNLYPDDIEASVQVITRGRVGGCRGTRTTRPKRWWWSRRSRTRATMPMPSPSITGTVKGEVASVVSTAHGVAVADVVLGFPGLDSHHHQRQDQALSVCAEVPRGQLQPRRYEGARQLVVGSLSERRARRPLSSSGVGGGRAAVYIGVALLITSPGRWPSSTSRRRSFPSTTT